MIRYVPPWCVVVFGARFHRMHVLWRSDPLSQCGCIRRLDLLSCLGVVTWTGSARIHRAKRTVVTQTCVSNDRP